MNGHEAEIRLMKKGGYPRGIIRLKGWANDIVPRGFGLKKNGRSFFPPEGSWVSDEIG